MDADYLKRVVTYYIQGSDCADMRTYGQAFMDHYDRSLFSVRQKMRLGMMRGARVLDLGCGFGWHALLIALLGDNEVVANDIRPLMIRQIEKQLVAVSHQYGVHPRVQTMLGDFISADIPDAFSDAIFCNQTIEHVHDLDACFQRGREVLRPGGTFVIANDNNCLTRRHLNRIYTMWEKRDRSWEFIEELKKQRPEENKAIEPYAVMREKIIRSVSPDLDERAVQTLVTATAGQVRDTIFQSERRYLARGELPERPKYAWCRNPLTGEYCERQFDPFNLKRRFQRHGFRVRLLQDLWRGGPLRILTHIDVALLNRILFTYRAPFVLVARKR